MEVILGNFALEIFGPIVASSVIATLIARSLIGNAPLYAAPDYALASGWEMLLYAGLGIVGALASVALRARGARRAARRSRRMTLPAAAAAAADRHGPGGRDRPLRAARPGPRLRHDQPGARRQAAAPRALGLPPELTGLLLLGIALAKLVGDRPDPGSGGAGGLFTPSLVFGALVGGAYGSGVHALWPAHRLALRRLRRGRHGGGRWPAPATRRSAPSSSSSSSPATTT